MKSRNLPNINTICRFSRHNSSFYFSPVDKNTVLKEIKGLSANKAVQDTDIPVNVLKENVNIFDEQITLQLNEGICSSKYTESFKLANATPAFKHGFRNLKNNYRPKISIQPAISTLFEKLMCKKLSNKFDNTFSKLQCGFQKGFGAEHCLLLVIVGKKQLIIIKFWCSSY